MLKFGRRQQRWHPALNDSGTEIPAYGALSITGGDTEGVLTVDAPLYTGVYDLLAFNGPTPIPAGAKGEVTTDFPTWAKVETGVVALDRLAVVAGDFTLQKTGMASYDKGIAAWSAESNGAAIVRPGKRKGDICVGCCPFQSMSLTMTAAFSKDPSAHAAVPASNTLTFPDRPGSGVFGWYLDLSGGSDTHYILLYCSWQDNVPWLMAHAWVMEYHYNPAAFTEYFTLNSAVCSPFELEFEAANGAIITVTQP